MPQPNGYALIDISPAAVLAHKRKVKADQMRRYRARQKAAKT